MGYCMKYYKMNYLEAKKMYIYKTGESEMCTVLE